MEKRNDLEERHTADSALIDALASVNLLLLKSRLNPNSTTGSKPDRAPDFVDDVQTLEKVPLENYDLIMADPPYSVEDCEHYGTPMVKRNKVMATLGSRLSVGCHVVWLDQVLPMYRKDDFAVDGVIGMVKSTNHRFRVITIFRRI